MTKNNWRHSYHGTGVDMEKVHEQARYRMTDKRSAWGTVVHDHPSSVPCKGSKHTVYDQRDESVCDNMFVDDGYEMWGIDDPYTK